MKCLNNKGLIHVIFFDLKNAFDKVPHKKLCHSYQHMKSKIKPLKWISDFLSNRIQKELVGGKISDSVNVLSDVPQCTILGLLLFICYVNNLPNNIKSKKECMLMIPIII